MIIGDVAGVSEAHIFSLFRVDPEDGAAFTSATSATWPTTGWCNNPRTELTSVVHHRECLKSEANFMVFQSANGIIGPNICLLK
jgi:hypothetical protein